MALASTDLLLTTSLGIWVLWVNRCVVGLSPWISWADTHSNFSCVVQVPGIYWRADPYTAASVETLRWATVACALLFFVYFGFAEEAIKNYRGGFSSASSDSASSDTKSVGGEEEGKIEVSSLHRVSMHIPIPTPPEPAHMRRSSVPDGPMPVVGVADDLSSPFHLPST
jgi:hypothetical protein